MAKRFEYRCCKFAAYSVPLKISRRLEVFRSFFCNRSKICGFLYLLEISPRFRLRIWFIRQITATKSWRPLGCQIHKALRSRNLGKNKCCAGMFDLQKNVGKKTVFFSPVYIIILVVSPKLLHQIHDFLYKTSWRTLIWCNSLKIRNTDI